MPSTPRASGPRRGSARGNPRGPAEHYWDLHPDGRRVVFLPAPAAATFDHVVLRFGFLDQLRQVMPDAR